MSASKGMHRPTKPIPQMQVEAQAFQAWSEAQDLREHALDYIDTYTNDEIAQMVREGVLTIDDVESGLRRKING